MQLSISTRLNLPLNQILRRLGLIWVSSRGVWVFCLFDMGHDPNEFTFYCLYPITSDSPLSYDDLTERRGVTCYNISNQLCMRRQFGDKLCTVFVLVFVERVSPLHPPCCDMWNSGSAIRFYGHYSLPQWVKWLSLDYEHQLKGPCRQSQVCSRGLWRCPRTTQYSVPTAPCHGSTVFTKRVRCDLFCQLKCSNVIVSYKKDFLLSWTLGGHRVTS